LKTAVWRAAAAEGTEPIPQKFFNSAPAERRYKQMKQKILVPALWISLALPALAQSVSVKGGNIQFTNKDGQTTALTSSGRDSDPCLSPDGRLVAFVRATPDRKVSTGSGEDTSELWIVGSDGKNPRKVVEPKAADKTENILAEMSTPQFSSDGRRIFFETSAWTTSSAVHVIDLSTKKEQFVCAGNGLEVIRSGEYKDCFLVQQHRYFIGGGSYDWYWLLRPDGEEVGPVGEETKNFKEMYLKK
jgi:dipeptidyl aminopeptidase/acylaminoacyl peptidase